VYGLMATTRWWDIFNDFTGLSERKNTTILLPNGELILNGTANVTGDYAQRLDRGIGHGGLYQHCPRWHQPDH
jgi:hypothetical protein